MTTVGNETSRNRWHRRVRSSDADDLREGRLQVLLLQQRAPPDTRSRAVRRRGGGVRCSIESSYVESQGLKVRELSKAEELASEHQELIIEKWHEHFNR